MTNNFSKNNYRPQHFQNPPQIQRQNKIQKHNLAFKQESYNSNTNNSRHLTNYSSPNRSENFKSPTFRTVGPNIDTTVNYNGQKYSKFLKYDSRTTLNSGYYGKSRLTRF
jgi:hypothetical protein